MDSRYTGPAAGKFRSTTGRSRAIEKNVCEAQNMNRIAYYGMLAIFVTSAGSAVGQNAAVKKAPAARAWRLDERTGLTGTWVNNSATPLERPAQLKDKTSLTDAEVADMKQRADRIFKNGHSDFAAGDAVFLAALANIDRYRNPNATDDSSGMLPWDFDNRTSLIIDPPDGRLPPYTPEGARRRDAATAALLIRNPPAGPEDLSPMQRCITWGVPMIRPSGYTRYFQIAETPDFAVVMMESIHDARIIPLDGRPHLPANVRTWNGDSVGHYEGNTLVVDTTNFSAKTNFMGASENLHLVERFTRVAPDEIQSEITVNDPTTWTKPWKMVLRLKKTEEPVYETACHEGNAATMEIILSAARQSEKTAKQGAIKPSK